MIYVTTLVNLKKHARQREPDAKDYVLHELFRKGKSVGTESRAAAAWGWRWEQRFIARGHKRIFWSDGELGTLEEGGGCITTNPGTLDMNLINCYFAILSLYFCICKVGTPVPPSLPQESEINFCTLASSVPGTKQALL